MDLAQLPGWALDAGAAAFVGLSLFVAILRGWLVPARTVARIEAACERVIATEKARADEWRGVAEAAQSLAGNTQTALNDAMAQNAVLIAQGETHTQLLRSIKEQAARRRDQG
jgi:hypothetical protein